MIDGLYPNLEEVQGLRSAAAVGCADEKQIRSWRKIEEAKRGYADFLLKLLILLALPREVSRAFCVNQLRRLTVLIGFKRCLGVFSALTDAPTVFLDTMPART